MSWNIGKVDIIQQQIQMLNLVIDLEQNQEDIEFERNGGIFHYVLDENIFEMFVHPKRFKYFASTFFSSFWVKIARDSRHWASYAAQSTMVASELLLSGELPGQRGGVIYMTEWHRRELTERIATLLMEQRSAIADQEDGDEASTMETSLRHLGRAVRASRDAARAAALCDYDPYLAEDVRGLAKDAAVEREVFDRFKMARVAAYVLGEDSLFEPVEQIARILDDDIGGRIRNLASKFPLGEKDQQSVARASRVWHDRLVKEIARQQDTEAKRKRTAGALWSDANSVALAEWASNACRQDKERVVLVTGDSALFNAYRRWFIETHEESPGAAGYFMLRRVVQYAPILNMREKLSDLAEPRDLINLTQQAMEISLLPFNLSRMSKPGTTSKAVLDRVRGHFALKKVTAQSIEEDPSLKLFVQNLPPTWFRERQDQLQKICALWKQSERIAIGSMSKLIARRLNDRQKKIADALAGDGDIAIGSILTTRASALMDRIVDGNVRLWIPAASRFIDEQLRKKFEPQSGLPLRAPIAVRISIQSGGQEFDLVELVEQWLKGDETLVKVLVSVVNGQGAAPELAYSIASVIALGLLDWRNAEDYANLAVRAAKLASTADPGKEEQLFEMRYLLGVATRFRVGEIGAPASGRSASVLTRRFEMARRQLDQCYAYYSSRFSEGEDRSNDLALLLLRTHSERAALCMFYAAATGLADMSAWPDGDARYAVGEKVMNGAGDDLNKCFELARLLDDGSGLDAPQLRFFERVRRQYVSNVAAYQALNQMLYPRSGSVALALPGGPLELIERYGILEANIPTVVRAEITVLKNRDAGRPELTRKDLADLRAKDQAPNWLALDAAIFDRLVANFG